MEELIKRALDGDQSSYIQLVQSIEVELYRIASARLDNEDDINDALQETMIHSYNNLHTLKNYKYFKTWIVKILINECNLIYRKRKSQLGLFNKISDSIKDSSFENEFNTVDSNIDFDLLIKNLKYDERIVMTLYYKGKYSPTEIAHVLNISVNTVKSRITRAREKLKNLFDEGGLKDETRV